MLIITLISCNAGLDRDSTLAELPDTASPDTTPTSGTASAVLQLLPDLPTVIEVTWPSDRVGPGIVQFRTDDGPWRNTPPAKEVEGGFRQLVLGVPYDTNVDVRLLPDGGDPSAATTIRTGAWPESLPVPIVLKNDPALWEPTAPWLITSMNRDGDPRTGKWWVFIMDRAGQVVWAQETSLDWVSRHVSVSYDQRALLIDRDTFWTLFDGGDASTIERTTLDGVISHSYDVPGLHHPFVPLPDGVIAWGEADNGSESLQKVHLNGVQEEIWHCADWRESLGLGAGCGSNALWWDEKTDRFLFSFWSSDTVVEIDHATGTALRWFGNAPGSWSFDPPESQFWWQHGAVYTEAGTLLVSTKDQLPADETIVREYRLNETTQTLEEVWNFGEDRGIFGPYMGEAHRLPNGNTLHVYGAGGHLAEATPSGEVAWEVTWKGDKHNGRTTPWLDLYDLLPD